MPEQKIKDWPENERPRERLIRYGAESLHPREAFKEAVKESAASVIFVHNHPSGDPTPSRDDIAITERLNSAGDIIGISVLDHVIIGDGKYISLKEKGVL
jgi:DNA repair protein RadC